MQSGGVRNFILLLHNSEITRVRVLKWQQLLVSSIPARTKPRCCPAFLNLLERTLQLGLFFGVSRLHQVLESLSKNILPRTYLDSTHTRSSTWSARTFSCSSCSRSWRSCSWSRSVCSGRTRSSTHRWKRRLISPCCYSCFACHLCSFIVAFLLVEDAQIDPNAHLQPPRKRQKIGEQHIAHWAGIDDEAAAMPRDEQKRESLESEINRYLNIAPLSWYCSSSLNNIISVFSSFSCLVFLLWMFRNETDPLKWWKENEKNYIRLSKLAPFILCIMPTSAPSERLWSQFS